MDSKEHLYKRYDVYKTMEEEKLKLEAIAKEARVELTPELRVFAWRIKHHAMIDFWDSAAKQAATSAESILKEKNNG